jgi:hypothetical protein
MAVFIALFASGCVYLRLLALKNQLSEFEKNFSLTEGDGLTIHCKNPVLHDDDLRWLGVEPKQVKTEGAVEFWHVRWVKEPPEGAVEPLEYDVVLNAEIEDQKVRAVQIPERYFEYFPKSLFVNLIRSTAAAKIDKSSRQADVTAAPESPEASAQPPSLATIEKMLGLPTARSTEGGLVNLMYRYRPQPEKPKKTKPIEVTFHFEAATGNLLRLTGKLPKGTVRFSFAPAKDKGP